MAKRVSHKTAAWRWKRNRARSRNRVVDLMAGYSIKQQDEWQIQKSKKLTVKIS